MTGDPRGGMPTQTVSADSLWVGAWGFPQCRHTGYCSIPPLRSVSCSFPSFSSSWDFQTSWALETLTWVWWVHPCSAVLMAVSVVSNTWKGPHHFATRGASFHFLTRTQSPGWMLWTVVQRQGLCQLIFLAKRFHKRQYPGYILFQIYIIYLYPPH